MKVSSVEHSLELVNTYFEQGYLNNPTATKNSITADGWFKTGGLCDEIDSS
jgi:long-subunit acyl-CoA synthetase (AMP-forming)